MLPQPPYAWALRETEGTQPSERVTVTRKLSFLCGPQCVLLLFWELFSWQGLSPRAQKVSRPILKQLGRCRAVQG